MSVWNGQDVGLAFRHFRKLSRARLYKENTETENVHFRRLLIGVVCFWGSVDRTAGSGCSEVLLEVDRAVVGHFGFPRVVGAWLQQNVGTADVPVHDRVWSHEVEVVQSSCHAQADGGDVSNGKWTLPEQGA